MKDRLAIAFVMINCNRRDGSARAVNEVAERLARRHDVHLFARSVEDLDLSRIRWHRVPGPGWPEIADFASFFALCSLQLRRYRFDIVHSIGCNAAGANVFTIQNIQAEKRKLLRALGSTDRVSLPRRFTRWLYLTTTTAAERRLYRPPARFLPVSRGVAAELQRHYAIPDASLTIIPNAADTDLFRPIAPARRAQWRAQNHLGADDLVAIFSGGEWARKGLDLAIEALAQISRPDLKLFVAGDDPARARFEALARDRGVASRVIFGGFRRDIPTALASADLFLFPSRYEAFSLASIEAAACGLPVITARINGTEELVIPGRTGAFVEHRPEDIAAVLAEWSTVPQRLAEMGIAARRHVEENFTWDRVAALTEQAYRDHLAAPPTEVHP